MVRVGDNLGKYDDHLPAGDGEIDWPAFRAQLQWTGFTGTLMLKIAGQEDARAVLAGAQRGRRRLREISRHLRRPTPVSNLRGSVLRWLLPLRGMDRKPRRFR